MTLVYLNFNQAYRRVVGNRATTMPNNEEVDILQTVINNEDIIKVVKPLLDQNRLNPKHPEIRRP